MPDGNSYYSAQYISQSTVQMTERNWSIDLKCLERTWYNTKRSF